MKTVIIASNNAHKVSEISNALAATGWKFVSLKEAGIESDPVEDAPDFLGNARIKARAAHAASKRSAVLADDSGLMVDALHGAPGVYSARYASMSKNDTLNTDDYDGVARTVEYAGDCNKTDTCNKTVPAEFLGKNASDIENNALLLKNLEAVKPEKRTARFVCSLCFVDEDGNETTARGTVEGRIATAPRGAQGFGYDPLFLPDVFEGRCTMAELSQSEKVSISHRGCALQNLAEKLLGAAHKK